DAELGTEVTDLVPRPATVARRRGKGLATWLPRCALLPERVERPGRADGHSGVRAAGGLRAGDVLDVPGVAVVLADRDGHLAAVGDGGQAALAQQLRRHRVPRR